MVVGESAVQVSDQNVTAAWNSESGPEHWDFSNAGNCDTAGLKWSRLEMSVWGLIDTSRLENTTEITSDGQMGQQGGHLGACWRQWDRQHRPRQADATFSPIAPGTGNNGNRGRCRWEQKADAQKGAGRVLPIGRAKLSLAHQHPDSPVTAVVAAVGTAHTSNNH